MKRKKKVKKRVKVRKKAKPKAVPQPKFYVIEKEIEGIKRLLRLTEGGLGTEFTDPPETAATLSKFASKKLADKYLTECWAGDFEIKAVPLTDHYQMTYDFTDELEPVATEVRVRGTTPIRTARETAKDIRSQLVANLQCVAGDLKQYDKDVKIERTSLLKDIKNAEAILAHFQRAMKKHGIRV